MLCGKHGCGNARDGQMTRRAPKVGRIMAKCLLPCRMPFAERGTFLTHRDGHVAAVRLLC